MGGINHLLIIPLVILISLFSCRANSGLPSDLIFTQDLISTSFEDFRVERFRALPPERKQLYRIKPDEVNDYLISIFWSNDNVNLLPFKVFLAFSDDREKQAKFTAYMMREGRIITDEMVLFYSNAPEEHIEWIASISKQFTSADFYSSLVEYSDLLVNLILIAQSAPGLSQTQRERLVWSVLLSRNIHEEELPDLRQSPIPLYNIMGKGVMCYPRILIEKMSKWLPQEVWENLWTISKNNSCTLNFETYLMLNFLAKKGDEIDKELFIQECLQKWCSPKDALQEDSGGSDLIEKAEIESETDSLDIVMPNEIEQALECETYYLFSLIAVAPSIPSASDRASVLLDRFRQEFPFSYLSDERIRYFIEDALFAKSSATDEPDAVRGKEEEKIQMLRKKLSEVYYIFSLVPAAESISDVRRNRQELLNEFRYRFPNPSLESEDIQTLLEYLVAEEFVMIYVPESCPIKANMTEEELSELLEGLLPDKELLDLIEKDQADHQ